MTSLLITQSLQRDFVALVSAYEPLPNRLHVGHAEALRLLGPKPDEGPVAQLMAWARGQTGGDLSILHVRDWHDAHDARQRDHLRMFGQHCIGGTPGAELVFEARESANEHFVNSLSLNDCEHTTLGDHLRALQAKGPLHVGVVGVWTEAKVSFLLYDLKTRFGIDALATCSALTASASRAQHFNALEQLQRILGVECFDSVADFAHWLVPDSELKMPKPPATFARHAEGAALSADDETIAGFLYRDSASLQLDALTGGFSGAGVYRARSHDAFGHVQAPSVLKIGPRELIAKERVAFERVEEVLGNNAPSVRGFVDFGDRAGIKYSYAAMGQGAVKTLKGMFENNAPQGDIERVIRCVFDEILAPFFEAARYERLPLLEHYAFAAKWIPHVRANVEKLGGGDELVKLYEHIVTQPQNGNENHYVSYVHGDLNGANILVDARENVWLIDFFHTAPGHVLKDIAKLENDVLYIFTPLADEKELEDALRLSRALADVEDLRAPLPVLTFASPALTRAWNTLTALRKIAARLVREDRDPQQMRIALLRYAVHTLSFDESSLLQKKWALEAATLLARGVANAMNADPSLRVAWMPEEKLGGRLGITLCPGRRDRGRDLATDLQTLVAAGVKHLVCLMTDEELEWAGVRDLGARAAALGIAFRRLPIADQSVPSVADVRALLDEIFKWLAAGESVVVHCLGGLGRSGLIAACALVDRKMSAADAAVLVRRIRGPRAIETQAQMDFLLRYGTAS